MTDVALRRRVLATLLCVLVLDAMAVGLLTVLLAPWVGAALTAAGVGTAVPAPVRALVVAVPVLALFLVAQLRYTRRETLSAVEAEPVDADSRPDLVARVERLAALADLPTPTVAVSAASTPNSLTVGRPGDATVVVSEGLLDAVDGDRLDAVLAHELAHLKNRDATVMTLASFLPALLDDERSLARAVLPGTGGTVALAVGLLAAYLLSGPVLPGSPPGGDHLVAFLATVALLAVLGSVALGVFAAGMLWLSHRLSRDREFAADRGAARLTGDPASLAATLRTLAAETPGRPATDARAPDVTRGLCLLPHGFESTGPAAGRGSAADDPDDDGFRVHTRSHPPVEDRIDRLQELAAGIERP